ncbi:hypothetical protein DRJ25_03565 [Candidatus Woesearchaeota archaeon]|nr:MAG: hypothetical protein DRJ25_03565 [Candidatus Woesearchaeota archaeon]
MDELEAIAKELGSTVTYQKEDNIEILEYKEENVSRILAVKTPEYQGVRFDLNADHFEECLKRIKKIDNPLATQAYEILKQKEIKKEIKDADQTFIGDYFELENFKDLSDMIRKYEKRKED